MSDHRAVRPWPTLLPALVCGVLLVLHAVHYLYFIEDDALISLRYSQRLLEGHGLTWNDGEAVEGYSNLLWVLAAALLGALGMDLVVALRVLGITGALAAIAAVAWAHRAGSVDRMLPALAGGFVLAAVKPVAVWAVGGLEQCLLAGLLAWALVTTYPLLGPDAVRTRSFVIPGALLGAVCLTRPDGALFTAAACLGLVLARGPTRGSIRRAAALAVIPITCFFGQIAFRLAYYGEALPNTARAKLGFSLHRGWSGLLELAPAFLYATPVVLAAAAAFVLARRDGPAARRLRFLLVPLVLWSLYVAAIGGDTFRARRHFVPDVVVLALMVAQAAELAMRRDDRTRLAAWASFVALAATLAAFQPRDPKLPIPGHIWATDAKSLGLFLRDAFGERAPLLAVEPAGGLPYYARLPALDMLGLNDPVLTRMRPKNFGAGHVGHELGDGDYTLSRRPDILMFCRPRNDGSPCFRGSRQIVRKPAFKRDYRLVRVESRRPKRVQSSLWICAEHGRLGITRTPARIEIPGFLLASEHDGVAVLSKPHGTITRVRPGKAAGYTRLPVPAGRWRVHVASDGDRLRVRLDVEGTTHEAMTTDLVEIHVRRGKPVDIALHNDGDRDAAIVRVTLERDHDPDE